jgi:Tol biopolymer transport system component/DNA-binding winged helix-turn-helix (wHTH) protein
MSTNPNSIRGITFGPFEYDETSGQLRKYGSVLRLNGKPLQILSLLLSRPGAIVSRDELQTHLWGGAAFGDFEQGLNSAVNKLRQTMGDSADQPRYIETVPGRGYRFIAPVQPAATRPVLEIAPPAPLRNEVRAKTQRQRTLVAGAAGIALALLLVAVGAYWAGRRSAERGRRPGALKTAVLPPRGFVLEGAASRQAFALSPDGARLAFTAMDSSGELSVFIRDFQSLDPRLLPGSSGAHSVFWSADGRNLYVTASGKLWRRSPGEDEAPVLIADSPPFMFSGVMLSTAQIMLDSFRGSYLISSSGGPLEPMRNIFLWPSLLPGSEHALYIKWDSKARRYRAHVLRLRDFNPVKDLMETDSRVVYSPSSITSGAGYLLYVRAGVLLAQGFDPVSLQLTSEAAAVAGPIYCFAKTGAADFSAAGGSLAYQRYISRSQLVWVDRRGKEVATVGPADINVKSARLSPDGQWIASAIYDAERGEQDLWIYNAHTGAGRRLTAEPALRDAPVWSPDSRMLAFLSQPDGDLPRVTFRGLGQSDPEEPMSAQDFQMPTDWSPDGRFVSFVNTGFPRTENEAQSDVWLLDLKRGRKILPLLNSRFHEANPAFSPDGNWLAFTSNESGRPELYLQAFQTGDRPSLTGERHLVSKTGASAVRWRGDGKELFYLDLAGHVQSVGITLSPTPKFGPSTFLFTISTEARAAIHSVLGFDVSPDGRRFLIARAVETPSLVVTQNWEALLPNGRESGSRRH